MRFGLRLVGIEALAGIGVAEEGAGERTGGAGAAATGCTACGGVLATGSSLIGFGGGGLGRVGFMLCSISRASFSIIA